MADLNPINQKIIDASFKDVCWLFGFKNVMPPKDRVPEHLRPRQFVQAALAEHSGISHDEIMRFFKMGRSTMTFVIKTVNDYLYTKPMDVQLYSACCAVVLKNCSIYRQYSIYAGDIYNVLTFITERVMNNRTVSTELVDKFNNLVSSYNLQTIVEHAENAEKKKAAMGDTPHR